MTKLERSRRPHEEGDPGLARLERVTYRRALSDGILDLGVGLVILAMAVVWLAAERFAGLAAIVPAALVVPLLEVRRRTTERRGGYVRFSAARRASERAGLRGALILGAGLFAAAVAASLVVRNAEAGAGLAHVSAGLPGLLIALPLAVGAALSGLVRVAIYALVALASSTAVIVTQTNPGWPLFATGIAMAAVGAALVAKYVRENPLPPREEP